MAAYAALVCLMNITEQILKHPSFSTTFDKYQIESFQEKVSFFLDFVERDSPGSSEEVEDLETQIALAAHEAEDVIESRIVDQILPGSSGIIPDVDLSDLKCLFDLQNVLADMDYIKARVTKVKEELELATYSTPTASSRPRSFGKTTMVGFDGYFTVLLEKLIGEEMDRQVIAIVGMGGIDYNVREILLEILSAILSCLRESSGRMHEKTEGQLGEHINKVLLGRRYLIILDDIWSTTAWEEIVLYLPRSYNRSRIIVTTRLLHVATRVGSFRITVDSLKGDESWNLLCEKAFGEEECPLELVDIGKRIVDKCEGLPLSVVVIGGASWKILKN